MNAPTAETAARLAAPVAALATALAAAPSGSARLDDGPVWSARPSTRAVAPTFVDGPGPRIADVVERLRRAGARATFFQLGANVDRYPQLARRATSVGEIANHTYGHRDLVRLPTLEIRAELVRASTAIERATGARPRLFRPHYGSRDSRVDAVARELGMRQKLRELARRNLRAVAVSELLDHPR